MDKPWKCGMVGGALVVLGTIFAVSVKSAVIDVTGGIIAALGAVLAGSDQVRRSGGDLGAWKRAAGHAAFCVGRVAGGDRCLR